MVNCVAASAEARKKGNRRGKTKTKSLKNQAYFEKQRSIKTFNKYSIIMSCVYINNSSKILNQRLISNCLDKSKLMLQVKNQGKS